MEKFKTKSMVFLVFVMLLFSLPLTSLAHSGRTDSSGGHHDYKNKSGLGSYHYHHGMGPHLHPGGVCPYSGSGAQEVETYTPPSPSISIEEYPTELNVGESGGLRYSVSNATSEDSSVSSSDPSVVAVNQDKTLTAKGAGTAQITISASGTEKTFTVEVKAIPVDNVTIGNPVERIQIGDGCQLEAHISPENATDKSVYWTSSDDSILEVSEDGTVMPKSVGKATITCTSVNNVEARMEVEVFEVVPEKIKCDKSISLIVGDTYDLDIQILPKDANNKDFGVACEDEEVLACSDLSLQALSEGETILHIETWNGIKKDIPVKVDIIPVDSVEIKDNTEYVYSNMVDKSGDLDMFAEITPNNATYKEVVWESSNEKVVSVEGGKFFINGTGDVTIRCIAHGDVIDSIDLTIIDKDFMAAAFFVAVIVIVAGIIFAVRRVKRRKNQMGE